MKKQIISLLSAVGLGISGIGASSANAAVKGDVNGDGRFTIADAVTMEKWLLSADNAVITDSSAADMNGDGAVDTFDYCLMKRLLTEKYGTPKNSGGAAQNDTPGAVLTSLKVSYDEAKKAFGYPIEKCTDSDFVGYKIGIMSSDGNVSSPGAICLQVTYEFADGKITLMAQDRSCGKFNSISDVQYIRGDRVFMDHSALFADFHETRIGYYPTEEKGIAYLATFGDNTDAEKIIKRIISLEI